jgi:hypothetical protein
VQTAKKQRGIQGDEKKEFRFKETYRNRRRGGRK